MAANKTERILWALVLAMFVAVVAVVAYKGWPQLFPTAVIEIPLNEACDLHQGGCSTVLPDGGRVSLSITPRPIPVIKPLAIEVTLQGLTAEAVAVDFSGVSMNMGLNRFSLQEQQKGIYRGKGLLPICIRNRMDWEAKVLIETERGLLSVPYRFATVAQR